MIIVIIIAIIMFTTSIIIIVVIIITRGQACDHDDLGVDLLDLHGGLESHLAKRLSCGRSPAHFAYGQALCLCYLVLLSLK